MKTSEVILLLFLISCGGHEGNNCLSQEQVLTLCIADKIKANPNPVLLPYYKEECRTFFPYEFCYDRGEFLK